MFRGWVDLASFIFSLALLSSYSFCCLWLGFLLCSSDSATSPLSLIKVCTGLICRFPSGFLVSREMELRVCFRSHAVLFYYFILATGSMQWLHFHGLAWKWRRNHCMSFRIPHALTLLPEGGQRYIPTTPWKEGTDESTFWSQPSPETKVCRETNL